MQTLEYRGVEVFLCYTHAWSWIGWIMHVSMQLNWFQVFLCWIWRTIKDLSAFTLKHDAAQNSIRFSFSLFYILLFSVHLVNINAAKSGTVFYNLSMNKLVQVVIWETLRACYFRRTNSSLSWFLFLPKHCLLNSGGEVVPWRALMFPCLRLSACFIYDKRVWVIYCTYTQLPVIHFWND